MPIGQIASFMSLPIAIICLGISIRAFYIYSMSRNDMLFVLGLSMAVISTATLVGFAGEIHLAGNTLSTDWARSFGACCGGLFIFLSSLSKSHRQMVQLRRWQIFAVALFVVVTLFTPFYPHITNPMVSLALNGCRVLIYSCAFVRYIALYFTKSTRFSLIMWIGFLILVIGYLLNIPAMFQSNLAFITVIAATIRIVAYLTLLLAYSIG